MITSTDCSNAFLKFILSCDIILLIAPLALNEPDFCKNSHLKYIFVEKNSSNLLML